MPSTREGDRLEIESFPDSLMPGPDLVQVWSGSQDQPARVIEDFLETLSDDERKRAARFRFEKDRIHFIAARGMLRRLLAHMLGVRPARVRFNYGKYDKPFLQEEFESSRLKFNISHSGGRALLAFAVGREVGIDIERIRPEVATEDIAERYFSACEVERLRSLPHDVQAEAFFNCWTRKEAFIKAIGEGLSCPLDKFDVTLAPGDAAMLLATRVEAQPASKWSMRALEAGDGYRAAIVVEGQQWDLAEQSWPGAPSSGHNI